MCKRLAADLELNRELVLAVVTSVVPRRDLTCSGLEDFRGFTASNLLVPKFDPLFFRQRKT